MDNPNPFLNYKREPCSICDDTGINKRDKQKCLCEYFKESEAMLAERSKTTGGSK